MSCLEIVTITGKINTNPQEGDTASFTKKADVGYTGERRFGLGGERMNESNHPEEHILEEKTNDFMDTALGFAGMFGLLFLIALVATIITLF
jgi:hypothetical protein